MHSCWTDEEPKKLEPRKPQFQFKKYSIVRLQNRSGSSDLPDQQKAQDEKSTA